MNATKQELKSRMTLLEFNEWKAYYRLNPFGAERLQYHMSLLTSIVAQSASDPKAASKLGMREFMYNSGVELAEEADDRRLRSFQEAHSKLMEFAKYAKVRNKRLEQAPVGEDVQRPAGHDSKEAS